MPSKSTKITPEAAQAQFGTSVEAVRAQLTLLESCVRAGRLSWALETAHSLASLVANVPPAVQGLIDTLEPAPVLVAVAEAETSSTAPAVVEGEAVPAKKVWTPPTPEQVQRALEKMFGHMPVVTAEGNIRVCTFNGHFLTLEKVQYLKEQLKWFVQRSHVILFQETNRDALKYLSNETGYGLNVSHRNARGQAVGILFHPRLKWLGSPIYHDYLTDIDGHPEWKDTLRPAVERRVQDVTSGFVFDLIDLHTKSNVGGPEKTAPIRRIQFEKLVACLSERDKSETAPIVRIVAGDMNAAIDRPETTEIEPLLAFGLKLVPNPDGRSTYYFKGQPNGQFDGFFTQGLEGKLSQLWIPEPLTSKGERWFYSEFSDHMPAFVDILV
ncbi:MAG: hypothetical protein JST01_18325 [Cyanobacteria bacterium SZAS TMP-1]|nr:hypothetical protein [Cyanobacteria bacterium SZAS TMP-1]